MYNTIALRKAKIVYNFGLSECNRVKEIHPGTLGYGSYAFGFVDECILVHNAGE